MATIGLDEKDVGKGVEKLFAGDLGAGAAALVGIATVALTAPFIGAGAPVAGGAISGAITCLARLVANSATSKFLAEGKRVDSEREFILEITNKLRDVLAEARALSEDDAASLGFSGHQELQTVVALMSHQVSASLETQTEQLRTILSDLRDIASASNDTQRMVAQTLSVSHQTNELVQRLSKIGDIFEHSIRHSDTGTLPRSRCCTYIKRGTFEERLRSQLLEVPGSIIGITGMGGLGKTELARQLAEAYLDQHPGKVLWISVGGKSLGEVQRLITRKLNFSLCSTCSCDEHTEVIEAALAAKPCLVVFDDVRSNFLREIDRCLPPAPPCSVIVTSRHHTISALAPGAMHSLPMLSPCESVHLLRGIPELAKALEQEPDAAEKLCERCGYHPLALTLAARRLLLRLNDSATPVSSFVATMTERLQELNVGERGPHASIEDNLRLSYDELNVTDQRHFRALSGFSSTGFCLEGLVALWNQNESDARHTLERLQNLSLVMNATPVGRFRAHDLLHEFACSEANSLGEANDWVRIAAAWLANRFDTSDCAALGGASDLFREFDSVLRCATLVASAGNASLLAHLITATSEWFAILYPLWEQWELHLNRALELGLNDPKSAARVHQCLGQVLSWKWEDKNRALEESERHLCAALDVFTELNEEAHAAEVLAQLAHTYETQDRHREAARTYASAAARYAIAGNYAREAEALLNAGDSEDRDEESNQAQEMYHRAQIAFRDIGDDLGKARALRALGSVNLKTKHFDLAKKNYLDAIDLFLRFGARLAAARVLVLQAEVHDEFDESDQARSALERAIALFQTVRREFESINPWEHPELVTQLQKEEGDPESPCLRALILFRDMLLPLEEASVLDQLGDIYEACGDVKKAFLGRYEAMVLRCEVGGIAQVDTDEVSCRVTLGTAKLLLSMGSLAEAYLVAEQARSHVSSSDCSDLRAEFEALHAEISSLLDRPDASQDFHQVISAICEDRLEQIPGLLLFGANRPEFEPRA